MPRFRIKKVTVSSKKNTPVKIGGLPVGAEGRIEGPEGDGISVTVNRGNSQEEKMDLLMGTCKVLDERLYKIENAWYRRVWRFLNRKRKLIWWK